MSLLFTEAQNPRNKSKKYKQKTFKLEQKMFLETKSSDFRKKLLFG